MIEIKRAFTGEILARIDAPSLENAVLREASLRGADLSEAVLKGADLSKAELRGAEMNDVDLEYANLSEANLLLCNLNRAKMRWANLEGANLEGAGLMRADLRGACMREANLFGTLMTRAVYDYATTWPDGFSPEQAGAKLVTTAEQDFATPEIEKLACWKCGGDIFEDALKCRHCGAWQSRNTENDTGGVRIVGADGEVLAKAPVETLVGIDLSGRDLKGANLVKCDMRAAKLVRCDLSKAQMHGTMLQEADLTEAVLNGANLREADLEQADLSGATLRGASLEAAVLSGTVFNGANLREASLAGADARGADFFGSNLFSVNLKDLVYDEFTQWPLGFNPVKLGAPPLPGVERPAAAAPAPAAVPAAAPPPPPSPVVAEPPAPPPAAAPVPPAPAPPPPASPPPAAKAPVPPPPAAPVAPPAAPPAPDPEDIETRRKSAGMPPGYELTDTGSWVIKVNCPFCAEKIRADAQKCRFCGEWLGSARKTAGAKPVPAPAAPAEPPPPELRDSNLKLALGAGMAVAALLALGFVAWTIVAGGKRKPPEIAVAVGEELGPTVAFPTSTDVGDVSARDWGASDAESWERVGIALGNLPVPAGKAIRLDVSRDVTDFKFLRSLKPADLHTLDLSFSTITDAQLENLTGLAGLVELILPPQIGDEGLKHLPALVSLQSLNLFSATNVTNAGVETLKEMKSLQFLFLPPRISDSAIEELQAALPKCSITRF